MQYPETTPNKEGLTKICSWTGSSTLQINKHRSRNRKNENNTFLSIDCLFDICFDLILKLAYSRVDLFENKLHLVNSNSNLAKIDNVDFLPNYICNWRELRTETTEIKLAKMKVNNFTT